MWLNLYIYIYLKPDLRNPIRFSILHHEFFIYFLCQVISTKPEEFISKTI